MTTRIILVLADALASERIELEVPLDAAGRFDTTAHDEWPATRQVGDAATLPGMLRHDADDGWSMRFSELPDDPDAPLSSLIPGDAPVTLGDYVSIREADGRTRPWQIVGFG